MTRPNHFHVDVFATRPLTGNGLAVFPDADGWDPGFMQGLTQEMKQFESIFLSQLDAGRCRARVFTVEEELPFAGHPVLGAAAVLHRLHAPEAEAAQWTLQLASGDVPVSTQRRGGHILAEMDQGRPDIQAPVDASALQPILATLGLAPADLRPGQPARVVSTGLPYLVLPVQAEALARARIDGRELQGLLAAVGAKFVLVLDTAAAEMRTWDNLGRVEDVATGSAAGPAAAYLFGLGLADPARPLALAQGRFAGRPSRLAVRRDAGGALHVSGQVWPVAQGRLEAATMALSR